MRYSLFVKFLALAMCALSLLAAVFGGISVVQLVDEGLYIKNLEALQEERMRQSLSSMAGDIAGRYAAASLSNCPQDFIERYYGTQDRFLLTDNALWFYTLESQSGEVLHSSYAGQSTTGLESYEFVISPEYPVILNTQAPDGNSPAPGETVPADPGADHRYTVGFGWTDELGTHYYTLGIHRGPVYLVTLFLLPGAYRVEDSGEWALLEYCYENRYYLFLPLMAGVTVFALLLTYLFSVAGRRKGVRAVKAGGFNALPIDVYALILATAALSISSALTRYLPLCFTPLPDWGAIGLVLLMAYGLCLIAVAFLYALAAQFKTKNAYLLRHSLAGRILALVWKGLKQVRLQFKEVFALLPLVWQWLALGGVMLVVVVVALFVGNWIFIAVSVAVCIAIILYGAYCFGTLMKSARAMSQGNLAAQVDSRVLLGSFRDFAGHLNALAGVAVVAGQNQARSERMKAELITNVSHDIKTPLTSIINYVDLMKVAGSPEEASAYLEVLDRQTLRLKKLIDDLMDLSKAATGNMPVEITQANAAEAVMQAIGEFGDKLEAAGLSAVFTPPEEPAMILADGRLTWRVLSNLLSNAVKYALPGTRIYVDMSRTENYVMISMKNVSRDPLSGNSDGLMERFVRGDTSRNTEGSGLGLNIASSLMELQKGHLQLHTDGDLFCATLVFPSA